jgi:hypothetical protein
MNDCNTWVEKAIQSSTPDEMVVDVLQSEDGRLFPVMGKVVIDSDGNIRKAGTLSGSQ